MKTILLLCILSISSIVVMGQVLAGQRILVDPCTYAIDVYLSPGSFNGWDDKGNWLIVALSESGEVNTIEISEIRTDLKRRTFSLIPKDTSPTSPIAQAAQLVIKFGVKDITVVIPSGPNPPSSGHQTTEPATNKQNADLYISGTYSPALNSPPQYQIDGFVALMKDLDREQLKYGQLGVVGSAITDKRKQADPDSYRVFGAYQNVLVDKWFGPAQGVLFTWLFSGAEFDRKADNLNFITAPYVDIPFRLFPKGIADPSRGIAVLTITFGFEAGHNFHNAVTANTGGNILRGVVSGNLLYRFNPKLPGFKSAELNSAYTLRLPAKDEIFTSTKIVDEKPVDVPFFHTKPRHYIKQELSLKVTGLLSLSLKHEYGALPPAFRMVDHKASIGLTFSLRQISNGVPSTIRNK
jgi:hypothetical protein